MTAEVLSPAARTRPVWVVAIRPLHVLAAIVGLARAAGPSRPRQLFDCRALRS